MNDVYKSADKTIKYLNRVVLREFNRLRLLPMDEVNILRTVKSVYRKTARIAEKRYKDMADDAYVFAVLLCGLKRDSKITTQALHDHLEEPNPVTKYSFTPERDRKAVRLAEALEATHMDSEEIDKAVRYWARQLSQYAIDLTDWSMLKAYKDVGVKKVMWVTVPDERRCEECLERDGVIYDIDEVPPKPHWGCRCWLRPIL